MLNIFSMVAGVVLLLGASAHVFRVFVRPLAFIVGSYAVPLWCSVPFAIVEAYAGVTLLHLAST
jgi:hypothetical protein